MKLPKKFSIIGENTKRVINSSLQELLILRCPNWVKLQELRSFLKLFIVEFVKRKLLKDYVCNVQILRQITSVIAASRNIILKVQERDMREREWSMLITKALVLEQ